MIDKNQCNSLDTFYVNDDLYIFSLSGVNPTFSVLPNLMSQRLVSKCVKETHIKTYLNEDFKGHGDIELSPLYILDILVYDEFPFYLEDHSKVQLYNVLISCYEN